VTPGIIDDGGVDGARPPSRRRRRARAGGFTLIELLVVAAVLAVMATLATRGFKSIAKSDLRTSTARLSGAMRYLFDRASTTGKYHRLVIDVEQGRYWAEVSDEKFFVPREAETVLSLKKWAETELRRDEEERRRAAQRDLQGFDMSKIEPEEFQPKRVRFAAFKESTLKPVTMKKTKVVDVYTPRLAEPVASGRAYIYFFPLGQAEAAIVHLSDPDGETFYSLVVHPITGRVRLYNEYVRLPIEQVDDQGAEVVR
jgi:general secretion pathway protein H